MSRFAELDSDGDKILEYAYGGLDNPEALAAADSTVYFVHPDGLGNVIGLVRDDGNHVAEYGDPLWDAWATSQSGELPGGETNRVRFKGALWLGDSGGDLYYMRARWYEPKTGRFLSEDPIGLAGGINPYAFAANDPANRRDPLGLAPPYPWPKIEGGRDYDYDERMRDMIDATNPRDAMFNDMVVGPGAGPGGFFGHTSPDPERPPFLERLKFCAAAHYDVEDLLIRGAVGAGAVPLSKAALGLPHLPRTSRFTNPISYLGHRLLPLGGRAAVRMFGTTRILGVIGRVNPWFGAGLLLVDASSIGYCVASWGK